MMIAAYPVLPQVSPAGSFLLILMSLTTLSFLVTTPETWVPVWGASPHGFPYLSGAGRLIIKDAIMLGAAVVAHADSAKTWLWRDPQTDMIALVAGVDLNHRPLGHEPKDISNFNDWWPSKNLVRSAEESLSDS